MLWRKVLGAIRKHDFSTILSDLMLVSHFLEAARFDTDTVGAEQRRKKQVHVPS